MTNQVQTLQISIQSYNHYKKNLLTTNDYHVLKGQKLIKKSWYRKLATAFQISVDIIKEECEQYESYFVRHITAKAIDRTGRFMTTCGSCSSKERSFTHLDHDVRSTAQTRASNRAISDLIWFWELSAEEMWIETKPTATNQTPTEIELITMRQKELLTSLVNEKYKDNDHARRTLLQNIKGLTKEQAREAIKKLMLTVACP